jgi:hypothetical protein
MSINLTTLSPVLYGLVYGILTCGVGLAIVTAFWLTASKQTSTTGKNIKLSLANAF